MPAARTATRSASTERWRLAGTTSCDARAGRVAGSVGRRSVPQGTWYGRPGMVRLRARPSPRAVRDMSAIEVHRGPRVGFERAVTRHTPEPPGASVTGQGTALGSLHDGWSAEDPGPRSRA